jgi:putative nucleotidyltransferase with HDIG domain
VPPSELLEALGGPGPAAALSALDRAGELTRLIPELEEGRGFEQPELHHYTVLDHNLATVAALEAVLGPGEDGQELRDALAWLDIAEAVEGEIGGLPLVVLLRLAGLLHDVAKPRTAAFIDGRLRFPRHGPEGAEIAAQRLPALGFGKDETRFVSMLVRHHLRPNVLAQSWPPTERAMRNFVADLEGHVLPLLLLHLCDGMATRGPRYTRENFRRHLRFMSYVLARALAATAEGEEPFLTGHDLMAELGLESGRLLGAVLTSVHRAQREGTITDRDEALALARATLARLAAPPG